MIIGLQCLDPPHLPNHRSSTQTPSHRDDIKGKSLERDNRNKGPDSSRVSSTTKCYKCQGYGHLAASCPSLVKITIIDRIPTEATEPDSDVYIFEGGDSETDIKPTSDDVGLNCINQTPSTRLSVVRCDPSQPAKKMSREKALPFTRSPKLKIRIVR